MRKRSLFSLLFVAIVLIAIYTQLTIFVVPPIGSLPTGMTIVFPRLSKTNFIDSPDAICERETSHVSLMCRGITLGAVATKAKIIARLPYSETLYQISLSGSTK